jgi:DNA/RNA endonuclease G (NUC1)
MTFASSNSKWIIPPAKAILHRFCPSLYPFPKALKPLAKYVAKVPGTTNNILKYHTYSVLFHSVRMMPAVSAINVDGNPKKAARQFATRR